MKNYSTLNSKSMIFFSVVLLTLVSFGENSCLSIMSGSNSNFVKNFLGNEEMKLSHLSPNYYGSIDISKVPFSQKTSLRLFNPLTLEEAYRFCFDSECEGRSGF